MSEENGQVPAEEAGGIEPQEESAEPTPPAAPEESAQSTPIVTLTPRESENSGGGAVLIVLALGAVGVLGWYVSQRAEPVSESAPEGASPGAAGDDREARTPAPVFKTERSVFPLQGFALRLPRDYPHVERELGTQRRVAFGPSGRSLQITMAPIYPWLPAQRIQANDSKVRWQTGNVSLPKGGILIPLPDGVRWAVAEKAKSISLIAGDRMLFIESPFLSERRSGVGGILNSFELLDASYQDLYSQQRGLSPEQALGKPTAEVRAKVDATRKGLGKGDSLPDSVLRGLDSHAEGTLTYVGTLLLNDLLEEHVLRLHPPNAGGHDHAHDHDHDHDHEGE